jgi:hypothetical protein
MPFLAQPPGSIIERAMFANPTPMQLKPQPVTRSKPTSLIRAETESAMKKPRVWPRWMICGLSVMLLITACAQDLHQRRAATIKTYVRAFYDHLGANRVTAAIIENEKIEAVASDIGQQILERRQQPADNEVDRDWMMLATARETAAENWLALGRYFVRTKRFEEARGTYQRVLSSYDEPRFRKYTEQAKSGLRDIDLILAPPKLR